MTLNKIKAQTAASAAAEAEDVIEPTPVDCAAFDRLADEWEFETALLSLSEQAAEHPAHQAIVDMGEPAVPLILARMQSRGGHWFHALHAITGANPVRPAERGNVKAMQTAWLKWGKLNGYA